MDDKDKEAYEKYLIKNNVNQRQIWNELSLDEIWQAACEYKQKEIDEIEKEKDYLCRKLENLREIYKKPSKLQAENAKLVRKIDHALFIMKDNEWHNDEGSIEHQVYKILEKSIEEL